MRGKPLYTVYMENCNACRWYNNNARCAECKWISSKANAARQKAKKFKALNDGSVNVGSLRGLWTGKCHYCKCKLIWFDKGTPKKKGRSAIDHKVPFAKGGANTIDNVVWSCFDCNRWKDVANAEEFLEIRRQWERGYRRCCHCMKFKLFSKFHKNKGMRRGISPACKACECERKRERYKKKKRA